jgi:hypothetical protein
VDVPILIWPWPAGWKMLMATAERVRVVVATARYRESNMAGEGGGEEAERRRRGGGEEVEDDQLEIMGLMS